jgi:hypothetical protein
LAALAVKASLWRRRTSVTLVIQMEITFSYHRIVDRKAVVDAHAAVFELRGLSISTTFIV